MNAHAGLTAGIAARAECNLKRRLPGGAFGLRRLVEPCAARCLCAAALAALAVVAHAAAGYDPLALPSQARFEVRDVTVQDQAHGRAIPLRLYLPAASVQAPVVLFSHGLGGSREGNAFLGRHWAGRGYAVVFLQHPGSDDSVWRDQPVARRMQAMRAAANRENFVLRVGDVHAVLDQLRRWDADATGPFAGRFDLQRVGMSGHSFGAVTTQAVSGQRFPGGAQLADARVRAALLLSPSPPRAGSADAAFGGVRIPWMLITGTRDDAVITGLGAQARLQVFPALPPGSKYELVLERAEHSAFTDRALPGDREPRNPNHHRAVLALSTAFWDAYLRGDADARAWLDGAGPRQVLQPQDRWQRK